MNALSKLSNITQPYPGLRPYQQNESELFFGRTEHINKMLGRLEDSQFLAVVGGSGSGKSSLVRAGLLPVLKQGYLSDVGANWKFIVMKPGGDPFGNLASEFHNALAEKHDNYDASDIAFTKAELLTSDQGFLDVVAGAGIKKGTPLLLLVDQFEEIFRFRHHQSYLKDKDGDNAIHKIRNEATAFVNLLLTTAEQAVKMELPIYVMITMRSDFIGACDFFPGLPQVISDCQFLVPRLTRKQLQIVIEKPIQLFGGHISPDLVNQILNDTGTDPDQLPLMQHALMRTWSAAQNNWGANKEGIVLNRSDYEQVGRFSKALSWHLDEAWKELKHNQQKIAKQLFLCLCEQAGEGAFIRRMVKLGEVAAMAGVSADEVTDVVHVFQRNDRNFIVASPLGELNEKTVLDISHEALLRQWKHLTIWIKNEASSARMYNRLADTAVLYNEGKARLLADPELQIALNWKTTAVPNKVWANQYNDKFDLAISFLDESKKARDLEIAEVELQHRWRIPRFFIMGCILGLFLDSHYDFGTGLKNVWYSFSLMASDLGIEESERFVDIFRVTVHLVLYLILAYVGKAIYHRININKIRKNISNSLINSSQSDSNEMVYAGFWRRFAALFIDVILLYTMWVIGILLIIFISESADLPGFEQLGNVSDVFLFVILYFTYWLYEALMTSRYRQATFGKMALGIYVTDIEGEKLTFLRASARFFGKVIISMFLFGFGFYFQPFTKKRQTLHDKMSGTLVARRINKTLGIQTTPVISQENTKVPVKA